MYIRKSTRTYKGKTYTNLLLVESVQTAKGPRQRTICSLGSLEPAPAEDWRGLAHKLQSALQGQESLSGSSTEIQEWVEKARNKKKSTVGSDGDRSTVTVEPDQVQVEQAREAGPVHVGHQLWGQLEMNRILQQAGLSARARSEERRVGKECRSRWSPDHWNRKSDDRPHTLRLETHSYP